MFINVCKKKLIIYLADLDHFRLGNRYSVPLGIGSIASYCRSIYDKAIDISLFKNPDELITAIKQQSPDILGCSFFMWNANLTFTIIRACKTISPGTITAIGGPNVARNSDRYKKILADCPELDIVALDQGERTFSNILCRIFQSDLRLEKIFAESIDGCASRLSGSGSIVRGKVETRSININTFPSPYLEGYFDQFLLDGFLPTFETVRGCPHQCTFCCGGVNSFLPLGVKNEQTVYDELRYIFKYSATKELDLADTNFGIMGERDLRISAFMLDFYRTTGFPRINSGASNKRKTKTSIAIIANMAEMMGYLYFALQTLTEKALVNSQRINIPNETIKELVAISKKYHRPIHVDMIFGLPGETLKSFLETIDNVLLLGIAVPAIYMLKMLAGTVIAEKDREKYGYQTKFRPLNGRYGEYEFIPGQLTRVIETEEIAWQNYSFNANDYIVIRNLGLFLMLLVGQGAFADTIFYLLSRNVTFTKVFEIIRSNYSSYPRLKALLDEYRMYSEKELFDSQEKLINRVTNDDNLWSDLLNDQGMFFKLDHGFSGYCLFEDIQILADLEDIIRQGVKGALTDEDFTDLDVVLEHDKLYRIVQDKAAGRKLTKTDIKKEIIAQEEFDYEKWRDSDFQGRLRDYRFPISMRKVYYFEKFDLLQAVIDQYFGLSGYLFYEKIIIWGPKNLRRLCRQMEAA